MKHIKTIFFKPTHLLDDFLAVVIEELVDCVGQQLILAIEQIVHLDEHLADGEVDVEVVHPEPPLLVLEHLGPPCGGERGQAGGEGAPALEGEDEHLACHLVQTRHVHLGHSQTNPESAAEKKITTVILTSRFPPM